MIIKSAGSVCSGIGSAPYVWDEIKFSWFAEKEEFQSNILQHHYPDVVNIGDMNRVSDLLNKKQIDEVDLLCGGTPCQAFSLAGLKRGLNDDRGNLTLEFLKIVDANDNLRKLKGKSRAFNLWENVEGVLSDKTNAFGIFIAGLAGLDNEIPKQNISKSGFIRGPKRNVAWRVLDAKYFGLPQQRRRVFVLSSDKKYFPENILFERLNKNIELKENYNGKLEFSKKGTNYKVFREYTDTLYAAYGTKWNGNSAAYNGSLFLVENDRLRRLTPLECERLMGFPDNYTNIKGASRTKRYHVLGNSWAIPVIEWIKERLNIYLKEYSFDEKSILESSKNINVNAYPNNINYGDMIDIVDKCDIKNLYISPVGAAGILRRGKERGININKNLKDYLTLKSNEMSSIEIERISKQQKRGNYSKLIEKNVQMNFLKDNK